jgi:hypothetical protein
MARLQTIGGHLMPLAQSSGSQSVGPQPVAARNLTPQQQLSKLSPQDQMHRANVMSLIRLRGAHMDASGPSARPGSGSQGSGGPPPSRALARLHTITGHLMPPSQSVGSSPGGSGSVALRGRGQGGLAPPVGNPGSVDINIHGTWARGGDWERSNSPFSQNVRQNRNAVTTNFQWSGSVLEGNRQIAGNHLANFIRDTQNPMIGGNRRTNAFAHSHGGNVLGNALSNNNVHIDNAVLLATPHMRNYMTGNENTAWTAQGANRVRNMITAISAPNDLVQTTGATVFEHLQGNPRNTGRIFQRRDAITPQFNLRVPPQGGGAWLPGAQAHSDMHEGAAGTLVNRVMRTAESAPGRHILQNARGMNAVRNIFGMPNQPINGNVHM